MPKHIYEFHTSSCDVAPKEEVGAKAHHLMHMKCLGLPVPEGFVIPTRHTFSEPHKFGPQSDLMFRVFGAIRLMADHVDKDWSSESDNPYLVSVRSGSAVSMPGMMDTVLNLGLNDYNVEKLAERTNPIFAWDCYRRLISSLGSSLGMKITSEVTDAAAELYGALDEEALRRVVKVLKEQFAEQLFEFPQAVDEQLRVAVKAVFESWNSKKAIEFRKIEKIPDTIGTGCIVQGMRFGNLNEQSCTGVVFSRNPNTGHNKPYGEFVVQAQGEDIVSGTTNARPLSEFTSAGFKSQAQALATYLDELEDHMKFMVDVEFTVEDGKLWLLQARKGSGTPEAEFNVALDFWVGGGMSREEITSWYLSKLGIVQESPPEAPQSGAADGEPQTPQDDPWMALGVGKGAVKGIVEAPIWISGVGEPPDGPYIMVAEETQPDDVPYMSKAKGIVTANGALLCHAAVVARSWGVPCVVGLEAMTFDKISVTSAGPAMVTVGDLKLDTAMIVTVGDLKLNNGAVIRMNGQTGEVWAATTTS